MYAKKFTALLTAVMITVILSACGGADIPISRLSFGMSEEEVKAVVSAKSDDGEMFSDSSFPVYVGNNDIDEAVTSCMFVYGDGGLRWIIMTTDEMPREECFAVKDRLIQKLNGLYGVSDGDWEIKNDGCSNYCEYSRDDYNRFTQLSIRIFDVGENNFFLQLTINCPRYMYGSEDNTENIPVIPKS